MPRISPATRLVTLVVVIVVFASGITITLLTAVHQTRELRAQAAELVRQNDQSCVDRVHQWTALRATIIEQNKVQPASPIIIQAFPQFKPFYTPGTPQYAEAKRIADDKRDRAFAKLGHRPTCST